MIPKKSFSQNFLRDESVVQTIATIGCADSFDWIVEIGAGEGVLTEALSQGKARVIAIELDRDLIPHLLWRFPIDSNVSVVEADILRADINEILNRRGFKSGDSWAIFGNIPYAITGKILRMLVSLENAPDSVVLMMQKEVAERIVAEDGHSSILSLSISLFGNAEILFTVPKEAFFPMPKVESAVIRITPNKNRLSADKRENILRMAKIGFASKRKTLLNNFASHRDFSKKTLLDFLETTGKPRTVRAENLSAKDWERLEKIFRDAKS